MSSTTMTSPYAIPTTISDTVLTTSITDYQKQLVDNVYNANAVLKIANMVKKTIDGGPTFTEILIKEKQNAGGFYLGADVLNNTQPHTTTLCEFKWQNLYEPIVITRDEERANSGSSHKLLDLAGTKMSLSEKAIADRLNQALSKPIGEANNLIDLETLVNTGTLGTIAGATYTFWQSTVTTSGAFATQGLTDMTTAYYAVSSDQSTDNPDLLITTKTVYQKYEQTRLPLERISNSMSANAGFTNLTFKGVPITYGNYINTGLMFGLNKSYVSFVVDSATDMITTPFISPSNQTVKVAYILCRTAGFTTNNRRRLFKLTSIS